jgi:FixJ family two-component response regulator
MSASDPTVYIVEDDAAVREALGSLVRSRGLQVRKFTAAADFLNTKLSDAVGCLLLDVRLPDLNGLELQQKLSQANIHIPIIFITGYGDVPMSVRAIKAGAVEFLTKPVREEELFDAIRQAIERDRTFRQERAALADLQDRFQSLTPRQRQVMQLVVSGFLNKQIAAHLGSSEITVKQQRSQVMKKMCAASLADLVRMAATLGVLRSSGD